MVAQINALFNISRSLNSVKSPLQIFIADAVVLLHLKKVDPVTLLYLRNAGPVTLSAFSPTDLT